MRWTRVLAILAASVAPSVTALAQGTGTGIVTGVVTQGGTAAPLPDVTVNIVGTTLGALTNAEGKYTIAGVPTGLRRVQARRIGFALRMDSVTVIANTPVSLDFQLTQVAVTLEQTVVIGYGTQRRADLTGSVSSVTPNTEQVPTQTLEQALAAKAPGVQVTQASSEPGGALSIRIRGGSSVSGGNEPLYVVDGFPIENDIANSGAALDGGRAQTLPSNPLSSINPADIESIDILKDASSTAIYGARGANGVVIITTKRGATGKPRVSLESYTGMQTVAKRYDLLNGPQFAAFANEWAANQATPIDSIYRQADITAMGNGTDWQDLIFRQAPIRNLQLGVSGGTSGSNATKYSVSGGVFDQHGVVIGSQFRRISLRGTLDQSIGDRFRVSSNLLLSRVNTSAIPTNGGTNQNAGAVGAALQYYPTLDPRRPNGEYTHLIDDGPAALVPSNPPNPLSLVYDVQDRQGDNRVLANLFGQVKIIEGLSLKVSGAADFSSRFRDVYYPRTTQRGRAVGGEARRGDNETLSLLNENTLTYERDFGSAHRFNAVAGYTRQKWDNQNSLITNTNFVSDRTGFEDIGAGNQENGPGVGSGHPAWTMVSYLGRVNYTLLDRYMFTVTARRDGSSRFGEGRKWGVFPSYAGAWRVSEEPLFRMLPLNRLVDMFKLRLSWGESGNPTIRPYNSVNRLAPDFYTFGGLTAVGYYPSSLGNPNLTWETTEQWDGGFDLTIFENRVDLVVDHYKKKTKDLLLQKRLPPDIGFSSVLINAGSVWNWGNEVGLNVNVIRGEANSSAFRWTTSFNYSRNHNVVIDLAGDTLAFATRASEDIGINGTIIKPGQPLGVFYGYKVGGILRDSAAAAQYTQRVRSGIVSSWEAGDTWIVDVNGDSIITADDRTVLGNPAPKFNIGWTNTIGWKRFELNTVLEGSYGATLLNLNLNRLESGSPRTNMLRERYTDRWTPENMDAKYPRIGGSTLNIGENMTSDMLEDGSFTRLRSLTLTYNVPTTWLGRANLSGARIYMTGTNLFTWTEYSGFNPDVSSISVANVNRGIDIGAYPLARTITAGVNLTY